MIVSSLQIIYCVKTNVKHWYLQKKSLKWMHVFTQWQACENTTKSFNVLFSFRLYHKFALINSLAPGRFECDSINVIFNIDLLIGVFRSSHNNVLRWMPQDLTDDKSRFVQLMVWCRQATSHYLNQCWLSSLSPYGVVRPQWVKSALIISCSTIDWEHI